MLASIIVTWSKDLNTNNEFADLLVNITEKRNMYLKVLLKVYLN